MKMTIPTEISPLTYLGQIPNFDGAREDLNPSTTAIDHISQLMATFTETSQKMLLTISDHISRPGLK